MTQYIVRRLMFSVVLVFLASLLSFVIFRASPGEVGVNALDDPRASRASIDAQNRMLGLTGSPTSQYFHWLSRLWSGDMGQSKMFNQPVTKVIRSRLGATLCLNLLTLFITWAVAIPLGIWAAVYQHRLADKLVL